MATPVVDRVVRPATRPLQGVTSFAERLFDQLAFYARVLRGLPEGLRYRSEIVSLVSDVAIGAGALVVGGSMFFVVFANPFFTGTEVGLEGFKGLQQVGAQSFTGIISSLANTREITPLVAGIAMAAQVGAGYTASLGAMRVSEEIDALEVMGVDSFVYLVSTRLWAALIALIPIYLAALFASYLASQLIVTKFFTLSGGVYQHYFNLFLPPQDLFFSFIKAFFFVVAVVLIHCYYGYYATGGTAGVGVAAGKAIRLSIIVIVLLNLLGSLIFFGGQGTARIVG